MTTLALKLVLTPVLIGGASLIGRRFGPGVAGWLIGLPFTSGPIAFFLTLERGEAFGATAAAGILAGTASQAAFCLAYAWAARRRQWPVALGAGSLAFVLVTVALNSASPPIVTTVILAIASLLISIPLLPRGVPPRASPALPVWDLPARMTLATVFVLVLTTIATALGPYLTGLLSPYPLYAAILAAFAQHHDGPQAATRTLRGLLFGLFAFAGFFLALSLSLETLGVGAAFAAAIAVALVIEAASFRLAR